MKLELYTASVPQKSLSNWVTGLAEAARSEGITITPSPIKDSREALQEKIPIVLDDLCAIPDRVIELEGQDEEGLYAFAYRSYQSRLVQGWNVSLYHPLKEGVFLPFDERSIARRVAHLYYQEDASDKVYHLYLVRPLNLEFYSVISHYGRRGRTLQEAEKAFDYRLEAATREWNSLHHEKIQKGYQIGRPPAPNQLELALPF
jgi:predicted DNA-binding WGR domain protein